GPHLLGRERGPVDTVATCARADGQQDVAHATCGRLDQVLLLEHADAHGIDERVPRVARREVNLTAKRRDPNAVPVIADPAHHAGKQIAIARVAVGPNPRPLSRPSGRAPNVNTSRRIPPAPVAGPGYRSSA